MINVVGRPNANANNKEKPWYEPVERYDPHGPKIAIHDAGVRGMWYATTGKAMRAIGYSEEDIEARFK